MQRLNLYKIFVDQKPKLRYPAAYTTTFVGFALTFVVWIVVAIVQFVQLNNVKADQQRHLEVLKRQIAELKSTEHLLDTEKLKAEFDNHIVELGERYANLQSFRTYFGTTGISTSKYSAFFDAIAEAHVASSRITRFQINEGATDFIIAGQVRNPNVVSTVINNVSKHDEFVSKEFNFISVNRADDASKLYNFSFSTKPVVSGIEDTINQITQSQAQSPATIPKLPNEAFKLPTSLK